MSLWKIAWRSIQQRSLASSMTAFSMALGVALVVTVLILYGTINESFERNAHGYDIIVGSIKEGRLELVLNAMFHLGSSTANVPWSYYKEFTPKGKYAGYIREAIPICTGDNYEGYRVIGTVPRLFETEYTDGKKYAFAAGRNFEHEHFFEAVIGWVAARKTGLRVGSEFQPTHGLSADGHKHEAFKVVGILEPTGTPNDKALFVNMEGFYLLDNHAKPVAKRRHEADDHDHKEHDHKDGDHDHKHEAKPGVKEGHKHDHDEPAKTPASAGPALKPASEEKRADVPQPLAPEDPHEKKPAEKNRAHTAHEHDHDHHDHDHDHAHHEPLPEDQREVSAILILTNRSNLLANMDLPKKVNDEPYAQAVSPTREITKLFSGLVGNLELILLILAIIIVVVAAVGIMVSIYNSMSERRREIAIMRSLGAGRQTVLSIVLLESVLLSLGGGAIGFLLGHGLIGAFSPLILAQTGVVVGWLQFSLYELVLIPGLVVLASLAGFLPGRAAYRTDVARALSASP
jgi:putative ABC transport system permease protein